MTEIKIIKRRLVWREYDFWIFAIWILIWLIPYFVWINHTEFALTWLLSFPLSLILARLDIEKEVYKVKAKKVAKE